MTKKRLGIGTLSPLLALMGVLWGFTIYGVCIGDNILNYLGFKAWTNVNTGIHLTAYYSLIFFIPSFLLGINNKNSLGAKAGKILSAIIAVMLIASTLFLART